MTELLLSPAVVGETLLWTREGAVAIRALVNQVIEAWDGEAFVAVTPRLLGDSDELVELTFRTHEGHSAKIVTTDHHGFRLGEGEDAYRLAAADLPLAAVIGPVQAPNGAEIRFRLEQRNTLDESQLVYGFDEGHAAVLFNGLPSA